MTFRAFEGQAQPHEPFWRIIDQAESESGQAELELYGVLSEYSWFEDDISPKKFKDDLYRVGKGGPVLLKINSPGGDVIAASVMRAILSDYPGEVTARIDGLAASAAVALTIAAKRVTMLDSAYMMIHDPAVVVFLAALDIQTLGTLHQMLKDVKTGLVDAYESRTHLGETRISHMMQDETWMSARQAVEYGFADEVITGGQAAKTPKNMAFVNCLAGYAHTPQAVLEVFAGKLTIEQTQAADELRARIKTILEER